MCFLAAVVSGSLGSCKGIDGLIAFAQLGEGLRTPASSPPARMEILGGTPVIHVYGGPQERGRQYGRLLARPLEAMHRCIVAFTTSEKYAELMGYAQAHESVLPPEVRDELHAISDASGMPYVELVALNITPTLACSALATWDDQAADDEPADASADSPGAGRRLVMGRNADYFSLGFTDRGMMVVVCHPDEGVPVVSVTFLGMIGAFTGMNARGVAFGNMLVLNTPETRQEDGLTIQLALRLAAEHAATADEMAEGLQRQKHVIPMNVMVADPYHALALELDLGAIRIRQGDRGVLVSTNHFMKPPIIRPEDSGVRYDTLMAAGIASEGAMSVEQMKQALWAARGKLNVQAVVFEPSRLRMHVSINHAPAAGGPYLVLDLHDLFTPRELGLAPTTQPSAEGPVE
jgi:hypothetical protein